MSKQLILFPEKQTISLPNTQKEAVIYFIARLDIEMVSAVLEDDKTYQNFPKYLFINKLQEAFEHFIQEKVMRLSVHKGVCNNCNKGCGGFTFLNEKSGKYMDILFETDGGNVKDIYECLDFDNEVKSLNKLQRIYIDNSGLDEF